MTERDTRVRSTGIEIDADKLRELRENRGLTQGELAILANISSQYVSQLETEYRRRVAPPTFAAISNALNIPPSQRGMLRKRQSRRAA